MTIDKAFGSSRWLHGQSYSGILLYRAPVGPIALFETRDNMTLQVELTPKMEAWLASEAQLRRKEPADVIRNLIEEQLAQGAPDEQNKDITVISPRAEAAIAWLRKRVDEEATTDPDLIRQAEEEVAELKHGLNENRRLTGERLVS
jgi:hypothetical protein